MEESTSQPSHAFIPQPIEQQLSAYQLGTLLEVYQKEWRRGPKGDRRSSRLIPLLCAIGGIVGFIISIIAIIDVVQSTNLMVSALVVIPFGFAFFVVVSIGVLILRDSLCVGVFSEGLMYAKGTRVKILRWDEIEACEQETVKSWYGFPYRVFKIHVSNGRSLKFKIYAVRGEKLGAVIQENLTL